MSLRAFHIGFILLSVGLLFGFGYWEFKIQGNVVYCAALSVAGVLLAFYLAWFISKIKKVRP